MQLELYTGCRDHYCGTVSGNKCDLNSIEEQLKQLETFKKQHYNCKKLYENEIIWYKSNCSVSPCSPNTLDTKATRVVHILAFYISRCYGTQCPYRWIIRLSGANQSCVSAVHVQPLHILSCFCKAQWQQMLSILSL